VGFVGYLKRKSITVHENMKVKYIITTSQYFVSPPYVFLLTFITCTYASNVLGNHPVTLVVKLVLSCYNHKVV
jgi:hypothetical protein